MKHQLTGSKMALAGRCLYWARPEVPHVRAETSAMRLGSAVHQAAELHDTEIHAVGLTEHLDAIAAAWRLTSSETDKMIELYDSIASWLSWYPGDRHVRREVPFAWDTATWTARELPSNGHRDYSSVLETEIPCTVDLVLTDLGSIEVVDYKTGWELIDAEGHEQLSLNALAAARSLEADIGLLGQPTHIDRVRATIAQPRTEGVLPNSADLDSFALDHIAVKAEEAIIKLPTAKPQPGPHCAQCPASASCPETRALVLQAREERPELAGLFLGRIRNNEHALRVKSAIKPMQTLLEQLDGAVEQWAEEHGGIQLPSGKRLVRKDRSDRRIQVTPQSESKLRAIFGQEKAAQLIKIKKSISVGDVEEAARASVGHGKKEKAAEAAMQELETTGAVKLSTYKVWKEV